VERARLLPDLTIGYNNQSLQGVQNVNGQDVLFSGRDRFSYFSAGVSIPLFFKAQSSKVAAAKLQWQSQIKKADQVQLQLHAEITNARAQVQKFEESLAYYENQGLNNADLIIATADQQFQGGEIDYLQWVILVDQAITIRNEYINMLGSYNQAVIQLQKLNDQ